MCSPAVFVSYDHRDHEWVDTVLLPGLSTAGLTARHDSELPFGATIYNWIDSSRRECRAFIIVISNAYVQNRSYARAEMEDLVVRALKGSLRVVPVFKEQVHDDDLPFGVLSLRAIRGQELAPQLQDLAAELRGERVSGSSGAASNVARFVPPERRIRIQASTTCTQECPWCHWDDFPRDLVPDYRLVQDLMRQLRQARDADVVTYPRPSISFALTGGEPLQNRSTYGAGTTWMDLASVDPHSTYLLTNGRLLDHDAVQFIREHRLKGIRIDLPVVPTSGYRQIRTGEPVAQYYTTVVNNIASLLRDCDVDVRFNYVVTSMDVQELENYLSYLHAAFGAHIGRKIKGVAFIQMHPREDPSLDVFDLANQWAARTQLTLQSTVDRKREATTNDGMLVEFTKLNCAVDDDLVARCFACVQEQDIAITADGRIRICSGWDPTGELNCRYVFAHFEKTQPLVGISGAIRRRYGIAGFYNHFGVLARILSGENVPDYLGRPAEQFSPTSFLSFMHGLGVFLPQRSARDFTFAPYVAKMVIGEGSPVGRLYDEGSFDQQKLENSTRLCCFLLQAAYCIAFALPEARGAQRARLGAALNELLLLLEYLSVDEALFSTGRTLMVRGMATDLLRDVAAGQESGGFLADASYCLAAVAFENCDATAVLQFLRSQVPEALAPNVAWVQYLMGCLFRQNGQEDAAIEALELAYSLANEQIAGSPDPRYLWLLREIRAEAKRSLGAIRKGRPGEFGRAQGDFREANFLSSIDGTRLRYAALFSDGYASMARYFRGGLADDALRADAYKAHRDFSESLSLKPTFYACLIRMGLLELALGRPDVAVGRLEMAKRGFSRRGLLTDQEYLNSILCDLIYLVAAGDKAQLAHRSRVWTSGIGDCRNVGTRDVMCVKEDAEFLLSYLDRLSDVAKALLEEAGVRNDIHTFVGQLGRLAGEA